MPLIRHHRWPTRRGPPPCAAPTRMKQHPQQRAMPPYSSFLVRFWYEPTDGSWHGEVEHVQSGERRQLGQLNEVIPFLAGRCGEFQTPRPSHYREE